MPQNLRSSRTGSARTSPHCSQRGTPSASLAAWRSALRRTVILRLSIRRCSALQASQVRRIDGLPFVSIGFLHILQPPITSRISRSITIAGMSGDFCCQQAFKPYPAQPAPMTWPAQRRSASGSPAAAPARPRRCWRSQPACGLPFRDRDRGRSAVIFIACPCPVPHQRTPWPFAEPARWSAFQAAPAGLDHRPN